MVISHEKIEYAMAADVIGSDRYNGAFYYSREIVKYFIPKIKTDRNWITVNFKDSHIGCSHAIVFVHNHEHCPEWYEWLSKYDDLILVCSKRDDMAKVEHLGKPIFLPLSVDVEEVQKYKRKKTKDVAFAGRHERAKELDLRGGMDYISNIPREKFLAELAKYKKVYALDRCAIEAKILGCELLSPDEWEIIDSRDAADMLQKELDKIDR